MKWNWKQEFLKMEREGTVGPSDQSKKISFGSDLYLTAGRNNFSPPKRSILFIFRPKFSEILLDGKHPYASPSSVFFLTQFCISLGKRKQNVRKGALVISFSRGKCHFSDRFFTFCIFSSLRLFLFSICFVFILLFVILSRFVVGFRPK